MTPVPLGPDILGVGWLATACTSEGRLPSGGIPVEQVNNNTSTPRLIHAQSIYTLHHISATVWNNPSLFMHICSAILCYSSLNLVSACPLNFVFYF